MLVSLRQLMDHAAEHGYGHPAFNISNIEQAHAVFRAARKLGAPAVIQFSSSARKYATDTVIAKLIAGLEQEYRDVPFAVHQDHGSSFAICLTAMQTGFSSVMIDGSLEADHKTVASFEYNVNITKKTVEAAHAMGVSVEGELGVIGSLETGTSDKEDGHGAEGVLTRDQLLTNPAQAAEFVKLTGVDSLAVAIGTSHGAYKFTKKPTGDILAIDRIAEISKATGGAHLVMHGSSSVPQKIQDMINEFGGKIPQTFGVPTEEIQKGIKSGVRKVNIDTDLRMACTAAIRKEFASNPAEFDPRKYLGEAIKAMSELCEERYEKFFCADKIGSFKGKSLIEMQSFYSKK
ncbi:MAG: fructose-bisphosphate aldolase class II [Alphaproteobacteria bacterium]|jgi:fructose-bisphosphate aldolase class II|nr:fructose-bisphosphate aldolase class II [Alphaproteobacteria bacterium]